MLRGVSPRPSAVLTIGFNEAKRWRTLSTASVQIARSVRARLGRPQTPPCTTSAIRSSRPGTGEGLTSRPSRDAMSLPRSLNRSRDMAFSSKNLTGRRGEQVENPLVDRRARAAWVNRLDADVVRACVPEQLDALADGAFIAPGDVGIDEAIGSAARQVVVGEAEAAP